METYAFAALAAALYGSGLVTTYGGLRHMESLAGARVSIPTAALLFWLAAPFLDWSGWHWEAVGLFVLVGLFYPAAVTLLTFVGSRRLGPTVAGTIGSTTPLFAVAGAAVVLGEWPAGRELLATAIIALGTMTLARSGTAADRASTRSALWMPWSGAMLRALAQVLSKAGLALWANPVVAGLIGYTVSSVIVWTAGLVLSRGKPAVFNPRGVMWFALTGALNGGAVLAMLLALMTGPVTAVAPIVATFPLFTLALSALVFRQERLRARLVIGVALTVGGVVLLLAK